MQSQCRPTGLVTLAPPQAIAWSAACFRAAVLDRPLASCHVVSRDGSSAAGCCMTLPTRLSAVSVDFSRIRGSSS